MTAVTSFNRAEKVTGTGTVTTDAVVLTGIWVTEGGTAGQVVLQDDTQGNTQLDFDTPGNNQNPTLNVPEGGVPFPGGINVSTLSNVTSAVLFFRQL